MTTTCYLVSLNRLANGRFPDDDYAHVGEWGEPGNSFSVETHALLTCRPGAEALAEAIMCRDPGVLEFERQPATEARR